jgi:ABC-type phosphate transport system auxiliary subunit
MLKRDEKTEQIISYTTDSEKLNRGKISLPIVDGRFLKGEFSEVIDVKFKNLPEATKAEEVVVSKIVLAQSDMISGLVPLPSGVTVPAEIMNNPDAMEQFTKDVAKKEFLSNLANLIDDTGNSVAALSMQINELNRELEEKDKIITGQLDAISNFDNVLATISNERANAIAENQALQDAIISTQQIVDEQNIMIEDMMDQQIQESTRVFEDTQLATLLALTEIISGSRNNNE